MGIGEIADLMTYHSTLKIAISDVRSPAKDTRVDGIYGDLFADLIKELGVVLFSCWRFA